LWYQNARSRLKVISKVRAKIEVKVKGKIGDDKFTKKANVPRPII
jgi:hypothetical protein